MATLIRAVETSKPQFDFGSIDVITDRRPIRKLYGFVDGETHEFRFGVTILGDTAFFTRMEPRTRDECRITEYRRAFETSYTKLPGYAKGSTSHHRIVGYNFGGLSFLVRSAVDAYYVQALKPELSKQIQIDRLIDFVKAVSLEEPKPSFTMKRTALGNVVKGGQEIPHEATLELTTRRSNPARWKLDPKVLDNKIADLWISQTANFVEAYHCPVKNMKHLPWRRQYASTRSAVSSATGCQPPKVQFTDIRVKPMAEKLVDWEAQNAKNVEKLSLVLKEVIGAAKGFKGSCIVSFDGTPGGSLKVCQAEEGQVPDLPDQLQALFLPDTRKE